MVLTTSGTPVAHVMVVVTNAGSTATTNHGEFSVPLPPAFQPGFPMTLSVDGWVVESPWEGHGFVPASVAFPLEVRVVRSGDQAILSHDNVSRIIKGQVVQFSGSAVLSQSFAPTLETDEEQQAYLRKQSQVLGFPVEKLKAACDAWVENAEGEFEAALAALYQGQNEKASAILHATIFGKTSAAGPGSLPHPHLRDELIALSSADYRLGHYAEAGKMLEKVLAETPYDVDILSNLAKVREDEGNYGQASGLLQRAAHIAEVSGDKPTAERIRAVSVRLAKQADACAGNINCRG